MKARIRDLLAKLGVRVTKTPRELVWSHRYGEAAADCENRLRSNPGDLALLAWHATAMLCLGRLPEALDEERRVDELERATHPAGLGGSWRPTIGSILWLIGRREEAIEQFTVGVRGVQDGSIGYGDAAGGVSQGLLLWYAGVSARDTAAKDLALEYLQGRAKRRQIRSWPGPLALFALGNASQEEVLVQACGIRDPDVAVRLTRKDLLKRRHLVNALFCLATRSRDQGAEQDCLALMQRCASIENPIVEAQWYLARGETG